MIKSGISIIIALILMASFYGCLNQNNAENDATGADNMMEVVENDTSAFADGNRLDSGTNNDSIAMRGKSQSLKKPFGQQKLDDSPEIRNTAEFHYKRGLVLFSISKYEEGIKEFDTVIMMDSKMGKAYINRGTALIELKKYREAAGDFEKAISLNNADSTAYLNLGLSYLYLGDFTRSIEATTKLISLSPNNEKAYFNRGFAYGQLKDFKKAISDFNQAIRINPSYHEAYFNRGLAYFFSNDKTKACSDWKLASQLGSGKAAIAIEKECK